MEQAKCESYNKSQLAIPKDMNSILFLQCNNGLGHIRRLSILANKINLKKNKIFFPLDSRKQNIFKFKKEVKKIIFEKPAT